MNSIKVLLVCGIGFSLAAPMVAQTTDPQASGTRSVPATGLSSTPDIKKPEAAVLPASTMTEVKKLEQPPAPQATKVEDIDKIVQPSTPASVSVGSSTQAKTGTEEVLDTIDIQEGGNWLLVRKALEDTVDAIEDINKVFTTVLDIRMNYLKKRNKADKDFNLFLSGIGFDLGDLDGVITELIDRLEQEREHDGDLTEQERSLLELAREKKEELKLLRDDVKSIGDLDARIDDAIMTVEEQVNTCRDYQGQAWKNFQAIKRIYDDEKAERLYQKTEIVLSNMQEIQKYLEGPLSKYFDETVQEMNDAIAKVKAALDSLKVKGIDLKKTVVDDLQAMDQQNMESAVAAAREKQRQLDASQSWFNQFTRMLMLGFESIANSVKHAFTWVAGLFMTSASVEKKMPAESDQHVPAAALELQGSTTSV